MSSPTIVAIPAPGFHDAEKSPTVTVSWLVVAVRRNRRRHERVEQRRDRRQPGGDNRRKRRRQRAHGVRPPTRGARPRRNASGCRSAARARRRPSARDRQPYPARSPVCRAGTAAPLPRPQPGDPRPANGISEMSAPLAGRRNSSMPPAPIRVWTACRPETAPVSPTNASSPNTGGPLGPTVSVVPTPAASRPVTPFGAVHAVGSIWSVSRAPGPSVVTASDTPLASGMGDPGAPATPRSGRSASNSAWIFAGLAASDSLLRSQPAGSASRPASGRIARSSIAGVPDEHPDRVEHGIDHGTRRVVGAAHQFERDVAAEAWSRGRNGACDRRGIGARPQRDRVRRAAGPMPYERGVQRIEIDDEIELPRRGAGCVCAQSQVAADAGRSRGDIGVPSETAARIAAAVHPDGTSIEVDAGRNRSKQCMCRRLDLAWRQRRSAGRRSRSDRERADRQRRRRRHPPDR